MEVQDLKVESASVFVTNANQKDAKYRLSSNFNTREGVLIRIDNGSVVEVESNEVVASFNMVFEYGKSYSVSWMGKAVDDRALRYEVDELIYQYIEVAGQKANNETAE